MIKKTIFALTVLTFMTSEVTLAFQAKETSKYFNGPTISSITSTSAELSLSPAVLAEIAPEEKTGVYFEYGETHQVCIMIYPTPESCLPKKTEVGKVTTVITNLKPNTSYTVTFKRDNTIRCITTPCPTNDFQSLSAEFTTKAVDAPVAAITKNLSLGTTGEQVKLLQTLLAQQGYLKANATGYYGKLTREAVKAFQRSHGLSPVGSVGPRTRALLITMLVTTPDSLAETFTGKVTAYSTACFADGECSITVDGKKVVTTIGWSQQIVGQVRGVPDFGSIENYVGAEAKVYAKKTDDGYTLYGNADYYVEIIPNKVGKLPAGSTPSGDMSSLKGITWVWQKTSMSNGSVVVPNKVGSFSVTLKGDDSVSGTTDCNGFFGSYKLASEGIISFGPLASTMMYCEGSQESVFTGDMQNVSTVSVGTANDLTLTTASGSVMYFLKK